MRYVSVFYIGFGAFSDIFLHLLHKYRCEPKIGFSAGIFLSFCFVFFTSIVVYVKLGSRLTFLLKLLAISIEHCIGILTDILNDIFVELSSDIYIDMLTDISIDILTDILTDKEEEGGGGRMSGLFLKI